MNDGNIEILTKELGAVMTNCYFITNILTKETIIVDPADNFTKIESVVLENNFIPKAILITHGHFDHILAARQVKDRYNIPIIACDQEKNVLENGALNLTSSVGKSFGLVADAYVEDQTILEIAGILIKVIHTPGHTEGCGCFYFINQDILISGDTLFYESVGRTDLPTGNTSQLIKSIKEKLFILPDKTKVFPGHGDPTTIENEKKYNPFCQ